VSQIFDALQKSEAERAGVETSTAVEATDMLRRMERSVASKWQSETDLINDGDPRVEESDMSLLQESRDADRAGKLRHGPFVSIKQEERLRALGQFQTLQLSLTPESRVVSVTEGDSPAAEAFRLLAVRLRDLSRARLLKRILITSTTPQEGKTTVAANLGFTLASTTQQKVLLVEGDVRRPALSRMLGVQRQDGICEWLKGDRGLEHCVHRLADANLWLMPAGSAPDNPPEVLQSTRLNILMEQLVQLFDSVIIDAPPVLPLADTSVWMRVTDGIILVTRPGTTEKKQLQQGLDAIESQKLIGALLNCSKDPVRSQYYY
jgi:capsular exopolysaccharide synthesis family protein